MEAVYVDWSRKDILDHWDFTGADVLFEKLMDDLKNCPHQNGDREYCDECGIYPHDAMDTAAPMMNYAYPLETSTLSDEKVLEVVENTNCTVVFNLDEEEYYLALTGCGMDLSQDIALAYILTIGYVPYHVAIDVNPQKHLSVGPKYWDLLKEKVIHALEGENITITSRINRWRKEK